MKNLFSDHRDFIENQTKSKYTCFSLSIYYYIKFIIIICVVCIVKLTNYYPFVNLAWCSLHIHRIWIILKRKMHSIPIQLCCVCILNQLPNLNVEAMPEDKIKCCLWSFVLHFVYATHVHKRINLRLIWYSFVSANGLNSSRAGM